MSALHWLMIANAGLWLGLGAYIFFLAGQQRKLNARLNEMEVYRD